MKYLFDTNIFIRSKNEMPTDVWPTFWNRISELMHDRKIFSSVQVRDEINRGDDELTEWMHANAVEGFYIPLDADILRKYAETQNWAMNCSRFSDVARNDYARVADGYLVATAAAKNMILVTYETADPTCKKRVKIPDACDALGVCYCDLNTALRNLDVKI